MMEMEGHRRGICEVQRGRKRREDGGAGEGIPDTPQGPGGRWGGGGPWCEEDWAFLMSARGCSARGEGEWREKGRCAGDAEGEF